MPRVKPLGIVKHMDEWEKKKKREARKEKNERIVKKIGKASVGLRNATIGRPAKKGRKTKGAGVSLKSLFGHHR